MAASLVASEEIEEQATPAARASSLRWGLLGSGANSSTILAQVCAAVRVGVDATRRAMTVLIGPSPYWRARLVPAAPLPARHRLSGGRGGWRSPSCAQAPTTRLCGCGAHRVPPPRTPLWRSEQLSARVRASGRPE